jgi:hypothetical protein
MSSFDASLLIIVIDLVTFGKLISVSSPPLIVLPVIKGVPAT